MNHFNMGHYITVTSLIAPIFFCSALFLAMKSMVYYSLIKYVSLMFKLVVKRIRLLDSSISIGGGSRLEHAVDDVIRAHYLALRCAQLLEELISLILLAQFLGCVIVWCLLLFYITLNVSGVGAMTTLILCEIVAFEMLAFSYFGSELTEISESLAHEIYSFRWYDAPMTVRKKVLLMSVRAQQIVGITALRFYYVSIEQFGQVMISETNNKITHCQIIALHVSFSGRPNHLLILSRYEEAVRVMKRTACFHHRRRYNL
ncbi:uncharacterized protein LOC109429616 isoform X1 [Aedes albopictus]|uniref:Odorant receptor n=1 Tax=Aedes albopictus TaxID=7160 RepID=A0ABM1ZV60_AEDAL